MLQAGTGVSDGPEELKGGAAEAAVSSGHDDSSTVAAGLELPPLAEVL